MMKETNKGKTEKKKQQLSVSCIVEMACVACACAATHIMLHERQLHKYLCLLCVKSPLGKVGPGKRNMLNKCGFSFLLLFCIDTSSCIGWLALRSIRNHHSGYINFTFGVEGGKIGPQADKSYES